MATSDFVERADQGGVIRLGVVGLELRRVFTLAVDQFALEHDGVDTIRLHVIQEAGISDFFCLAARRR